MDSFGEFLSFDDTYLRATLLVRVVRPDTGEPVVGVPVRVADCPEAARGGG
jgi:hypothetical protein